MSIGSLQRGKTPPPPWVFWIWHLTIWWCDFSSATLENAEYYFIAITPGLLWPKVVAPDKVLFMGQIEQFDHLTVCKQMTNWIISDT